MWDIFWAYLFFGLSMVPITVYFNQFLFFVFAFYVSIRKFYKKGSDPLEYFPGVSIVKPLTGVDPLLSENIISHMELRYPNFEIIFCVEDPNDPAIELVQSLFRKYPNVDARLIIGGNGNVINPMVNNLLPGYESVKYDLVWLSTSRIKANTDIMLDMVRKSEDPHVGLVHQLPFVCDQRGFMNSIEKVCFGCALGRSSLALNQMKMLCFTGMSYMFRKSILDRYGGFERFGKFLAEDYFFSKELFENGYSVVLSAYPAQQNVANVTMNVYVTRMMRWLRLRLNMLTIVAAFFEPMIECLNLGLLMALSMRYFFAVSMLTTLAVHISVWMFLDYCLLRCIQGGPLPFSIVTFFFAWWTRELLTYVIYVKAVLHPRTVKWGANTYRLSLGGHTELLRAPNTNGGSATTLKRTKSTEDIAPPPYSTTSTGLSEGGARGATFKLKTSVGTAVKVGGGSGGGGSSGKMNSWRNLTQSGYIRGSLDQQHIALISDA